MKNFIRVLVVLLILGVVSISFGYFIGINRINNHSNDIYFLIAFLLITTIYVVIFFIRKKLSYKNFFISDKNIFTEKVKLEKTYDIPKELMFEKVKEVLRDSKFKLRDINEQNFEFLATTKCSFRSCGENLYIDFKSKDDKTTMNFCSTTLIDPISFGKNKKNYDDLIAEIEDSLII